MKLREFLFWSRAAVVAVLCAVFMLDCRGGAGLLGVVEAFFERLSTTANMLLALLLGFVVFMVYTEDVLRVFSGRIASVLGWANLVFLVKLVSVKQADSRPFEAVM